MILLVVFAMLGATALSAQESLVSLRSDPIWPDAEAPQLPPAALLPDPDGVRVDLEMFVVGAVTGAAAWGAGVWLGASLEGDRGSSEYDGLFGGLLGGMVVPMFAIPLSVHAVNDRGGSLPETMRASLLGGLAGLALGLGTKSLTVAFIAPPVLELLGSVMVESQR
jgi:hypothetical protein